MLRSRYQPAVWCLLFLAALVASASASAVDFSGTVYTNEGTTPMGSGRVVRLKVNGGGDYSAVTNGSGVWSMTAVTAAAGDVLTFFLDGATEKASTVSTASGSNQSGIHLYQNFLIVRSDDGSALTNANLSLYDLDDDVDIVFSSNAGTLFYPYTVTLLLNTASTFAPGGLISGGSFKQTSGTFDGGTSSFDINDGNFTLTGGSFTAGTNGVAIERNVTFSGGTLTNGSFFLLNGLDNSDDSTIACTGTFPGIVVFGKQGSNASVIAVASGCTVSLGVDPVINTPSHNGADITVDGTLVIDGGTLTFNAGGADVDLINNGTITHNGSGWVFNLAGLRNNSGGVITYAGSALSIDGDFTQSGTFDLTGKTVTLSGDHDYDNTIVSCSGALGGTVVINKTTVENGTSSSVQVAAGCQVSLGANPVSVLADYVGQADLTINGTVIVESGTWTVNGADSGVRIINNGTITHNGSGWDINGAGLTNNGTITYAGTTLSLEGGLTQSGTFDLTGKMVTVDGSDDDDVSVITCSGTLGGTLQLRKDGAVGISNYARIASGCQVSLGTDPLTTMSDYVGASDLINDGTIVIEGGKWTIDAVGESIKVLNNGTITHNGNAWELIDSGLVNNGIITYGGSAIEVEYVFWQNGTFNLAGKTVTIDGSGNGDDSSVDCNGTLGGTLVINKTGSGSASSSVLAGCTVSLGAAPVTTLPSHSAADFTNSGTVIIESGTWTVNAASQGVDVYNNGFITHSGAGWDLNNASLINNAGGSISFAGALSVETSITQNGTFNMSGVSVLLDDSNDNSDDCALTCGSSSLGSLTINKTATTATVTLASDCAVLGSFTRTNGPLSNPAGALVLTLGGAISTSTTDTLGGANLTVVLAGNTDTTLTQSGASWSSPLRVAKTGAKVTLASDLTTLSTLEIASGTLDQGATYNVSTGAVAVAAAGSWVNIGTGDCTLSGGVINSGFIAFDGSGGGCGGTDAILIRSSVAATQRAWSGTGVTRMFDVDVQDQSGTLIARSSTNTGNSNWTFSGCTGARIWDGGGADNNWSTAANWDSDTLPISTDEVYFDYTSAKDVTIDSAVTAASLTIANAYTGAITRSAALTVSGALLQQSGNFNGGSGGIALGSLIIGGGAFTAPDANLDLTADWGVLSISGGTFTHNGGTVKFSGSASTMSTGSAALNHLWIAHNNTDSAFTVTGSTRVNGNLTISSAGELGSGTIEVAGNITTTDLEVRGTGKVEVDGGGDQTVSAVGGTGALPAILVNKSAGTLFLEDTIRLDGLGTVFSHSAGTVSAGTGEVVFRGMGMALSPGPVAFHDVTLHNWNNLSATAITGTLDVNGTLTITEAGDITGAIAASGDVTGSDASIEGTATVTFDGTANQTVSAADLPNGDITINKPSGTVTLGANAPWNGSGQDLFVTAGTFDQGASYDLTTGTVTVATGATWSNTGTGDITLAGGVVNNGTVTIRGATP